MTEFNINELLGHNYTNYSSFKHNYFSKVNDDWCTSEDSEEVVKYISGTCVKHLKNEFTAHRALESSKTQTLKN